MKSTLHMQYIANCRPFRSTIIHFQDIAQFRIFQLTPMLKFATDRKNIYNFTFTMTSFYTIKLARSDQNCRRCSVLKFPALWKNVLLVRWLLLRLLEGCSDAVPAVFRDRQGQLSQPITVQWQAAGRFPLNPIKLSSLIN